MSKIQINDTNSFQRVIERYKSVYNEICQSLDSIGKEFDKLDNGGMWVGNAKSSALEKEKEIRECGKEFKSILGDRLNVMTNALQSYLELDSSILDKIGTTQPVNSSDISSNSIRVSGMNLTQQGGQIGPSNTSTSSVGPNGETPPSPPSGPNDPNAEQVGPNGETPPSPPTRPPMNYNSDNSSDGSESQDNSSGNNALGIAAGILGAVGVAGIAGAAIHNSNKKEIEKENIDNNGYYNYNVNDGNYNYNADYTGNYNDNYNNY